MNPATAPLPAVVTAADAAFPVMAVRTRVHALKAGTFPAAPLPLTVTAADLAALAAAYDPARYRAPVVIGHPEDDHPAWGWVSEATTDDAGLWLTVDLLPEMAELIRDRRYAQVSVALWTPEAPGNPAPGAYALKHLGFLGAVPPAVKGLSPVRLSEDPARHEGVAVITCEEHPMPDTIDYLRGVSAPADAVTLSEREAALATREAQLARRERELRQAQYRAEVEAHVAAGRITAAEVPGLVAVLEALSSAPTVQLSDAETIAPQDALRAHLAALPPRVTLGEHAPPEPRGTEAPLPKVPAGYRLSEAGLDLHTRALQYQHAHPAVDYLAAVRAVSR